LLQLFSESKQASRGRFMIMQLEADASAQATAWLRVFFAAGRLDQPSKQDPTAKDFVYSPRHGVEFLLTKPDAENRVTWRSGRFMPAYGIGFAEHTLVTRQWLDFQPGEERYASEVAWSNDQASAIATAIFSQTEGNGIMSEKGGALQIARAIGQKSKAGANYYQTQRRDADGKSDGSGIYTRRLIGAFAHVGFTKDWYGLLEVDRTQGLAQRWSGVVADTSKWGLVESFKLGYEITQGLQLVAIQEFANLNTEQTLAKFDAYSIGAEWFPRPHWDLYTIYRKERFTSGGNDYADVVWLVGHFYL
jgi:hypothetical protein